MSIDLDKLINENNILDRLTTLEKKVSALQTISIQADELSEISDDLGIINSGMFIAGVGIPGEESFSGTAMVYPAIEVQIGENTYELSILGAYEGTIQFGLSAVNGQAIYAAGRATIGESGIVVNGVDMTYDHNAALDDGSGAKRLRLGIFSPINRTDLLVGGFRFTGSFRKFISGTSSGYVEALGTNRGFEEGTIDQFTKTSSNSTYATYAVNTESALVGTYGCYLKVTRGWTTNTWSYYIRLETNLVSVTAGQGYTFSLKSKLLTLTYQGNVTSSKSTHTYTARINWYDSSSTYLTSTNISTTAPISSIRSDTLSAIAPSGAAYASIWVQVAASKTSNNSGTIIWQIAVDDFSITYLGIAPGDGSWTEEEKEVHFYIDREMMVKDIDDNVNKIVAADMNLLPPSTACTATASAVEGNVPVGSHLYKITFVDLWGETNTGPVSNEVNLESNLQVDLTDIPIGPWGTKTRRIYRTKSGETSPYYLVGELLNNEWTTYTDNVNDFDIEDSEATPVYAPGVNTSGSRPILPGRVFLPWVELQGVATSVITSTSQRLGFYTQQTSAKNKDEIWTSFYAYAGIYTLKLCGIKNTNKAKVDVYIDNVLLKSGLDWYASSVTYNIVVTINNVEITTSGYHILKFVVNGKNSSATDYSFALTYVVLFLEDE